jgi:hypothetical protein
MAVEFEEESSKSGSQGSENPHHTNWIVIAIGIGFLIATCVMVYRMTSLSIEPQTINTELDE